MYKHLTDSKNWPPNVAYDPNGKLALWVCNECSYTYDPSEGDEWLDLPPGVPLEALPDDWVCPECGGDKDQFFR